MHRSLLLPGTFGLFFIVTAIFGVTLLNAIGVSRVFFLNIGWILSSLWAASACLVRATKESESKARWAWRSFGVACGSWCAGQILWTTQEFISGEGPGFAALPDLVFSGTGPFLFGGFFLLCGRNTAAVGTTRKLCNLAILSCSSTIVVLPLCKEIVLTAQSELAFMLPMIGGGVLIIAAFFGGILCLWLYTPASAVVPTTMMVVASGLITAGTLQYAFESIAGTYRIGNVGDLLYFVAFALITAAARIRWEEIPSKQSPLQRSIHLAYTEATITATCMLAVLAIVLWRRDDYNSLLTFAMPALGLLAISVGVREASNARLEERLFEKLRSSERRFRALVEHASDGIAAWDIDGTIRYATASNLQLIGETPEELIGRQVSEFFHPEDAAGMERARKRALENPRVQVPVKARVRHKNGSWRHCEGVLTNLIDDPAVGALVVNYHDVTERHRAEEALGESKAQLRAFMENNPTHMFIKDRAGRYLHVNRKWLEASGCTLESVLGLTDWEIFPADLARTYVNSDEKTFTEGELVQIEEPVLDGKEWRTSIVQKFPLRDAAGEITSIGGIVTDITERVRAEQSLRRSEERYRNLVEGARDAIFTLSPQGVLTSANPAAEMITGVPNTERLGQSFLTMVVPAHSASAIDTFHAALTGKKPEPIEILILGANGREVLMEITASPQFDGDQVVGVLGIGRDIAERRALQDQLQQAQKMESVGQLAGGVAHDFNNLLTVILGNASLIEIEQGLPATVVECVQQISEASDRAAALTRQLLAFSRRQVIRPRSLNLDQVIGGLTNMLRSLLREDIRLQVQSSSNLPTIHADAGMIEQVLLNLSVNARDAMPQGGNLTISTSHVTVTEAEARTISEASAGHFVRISVTDTGKGIEPGHLRHIFEPFYTTKDVGQGTGLGLATVYGIVQQHEGWITVESATGEGTTFHVHLPIEASPPDVEIDAPSVAHPLPRGEEMILVVEDEAPLRVMVKAILNRLGYRVLEAISGVEAVQLWQQHRDEIDLVFTDMVMPGGLSGQQLVEQLREERPDLPILFTTGYSAQMVERNGGLPPDAHCLQKPYLPPDLAAAVRAALSGPPSAKVETGCSPDLPHRHGQERVGPLRDAARLPDHSPVRTR